MAADVIYLHGFASSPKSTKASFLSERLRARGVAVRCPDFNQPDFATLTMTRMLAQLVAELPPAPSRVTLIGSSLGGTLAVLAAERFPARVDRIVLLAPAVMFAKEGHHLLSPERIAEWRAKGELPFFHYGDNVERPLWFTFYEDSLRYNAFDASFSQPAIIFQGQRDTSVIPSTVDAFAHTRPNVTLVRLDDDHQLTGSLPVIWKETARFLGLFPESELS